MKEVLDGLVSEAAVHKAEIVRSIDKVIRLIGLGDHAAIEKEMAKLDKNRDEYIAAMEAVVYAAVDARGTFGGEDVNVDKYRREYVEAKSIVDFARAAAHGRLGICKRVGMWLCGGGGKQSGSGRRTRKRR